MFSDEISPDTIDAFELALTSGGDSRTCLTKSGRNKYHSSARPLNDTALFGSCTSSSVATNGYDAALTFFRQLEAVEDETQKQETIEEHYGLCRRELLSYVMNLESHTAQAIIAPSGTDAEYLALWVAWISSGKKPISNIIIGPTELGSGSIVAAAAKYFDDQTPVNQAVTPGNVLDEELAAATKVYKVSIRDQSGDTHHHADMDDEVRDLVKREIDQGRHVLLHMVAHSKTGIHAPTLDTVHELKDQYGIAQLSIIVDAAQGRFSRTGMRQIIAENSMAIITGSKFFGGPGFCGAVVIPECYIDLLKAEDTLPAGFDKFFCADMFPTDWDKPRSALSNPTNLGVLLRWRASLAEIIRYYHTPSHLRYEVMHRFRQLAPAALHESKYITMIGEDESDKFYSEHLLQSNTTVFFFTLGKDKLFNKAELYEVFRWLNYDLSEALSNLPTIKKIGTEYKFQIGQPVTLMKNNNEEISVLRIAIGGVMISDFAIDLKYGHTLNQRMTFLQHQLEFLVNKLDIITENFQALSKSDIL
ncbi:MAG: hypothetical protein ISR69_09200 [Gammaproteobacteria bacterium]|nr:hypothetical protein [Gammaproteobacteria bacterium]